MKIRNRMADIIKLRCNACQDYIEMVICPDWQNQLYTFVKEQVEGGRHKDNYIETYGKMRDIGPENYSVKEMDVSFIAVLVSYSKDIVHVSDAIKKSILKLKEDRNLTDHSNENEEEEELYLRGLLALCDIRSFVKIVDKDETIDDQLRLAFRKNYMSKIEELMTILDEERIELIQKRNDMERDIKTILDSPKPETTWLDVFDLYSKKYWKTEKNPEYFYEFILKASDAGVKEAHAQAAIYYYNIAKNYPEGERTLQKIIDSNDTISLYEAKFIVDTINGFISQGNKMTKGATSLITAVKEYGYEILEKNDGLYALKEKNLKKRK